MKKQSKSPNAKKNQHKLRVIENTRRILDKITIAKVYTPESHGQNSIVFSRGIPTKVSHSLAWHLDNIRVYWEITAGVICRNQQGKHYFEYITFQSKEPTLSGDMSELTKNVCALLFARMNKLHKLVPFWLAKPRFNTEEKSIDLILLLHLLEHCKSLDKIASNFEILANMPEQSFHTGNWFDIPMDWDRCKETDLITIEEVYDVQIKTVKTEDGNQVSIVVNDKVEDTVIEPSKEKNK